HLDSNDFFLNSTGRPIPPFQQNNYGASIGGPVELPHLYHGRDKTFFFFNYEAFRLRQGITGTELVPSRAQLAGNLADDSAGTGILPTSSAFCQANRTSAKCHDIVNPVTGLPFPGNNISSALN